MTLFSAGEGVNIRLMDPFTIKPIDREAILANAKECGGKIITVEDHYPEVRTLLSKTTLFCAFLSGNSTCKTNSEVSSLKLVLPCVHRAPRHKRNFSGFFYPISVAFSQKRELFPEVILSTFARFWPPYRYGGRFLRLRTRTNRTNLQFFGTVDVLGDAKTPSFLHGQN